MKEIKNDPNESCSSNLLLLREDHFQGNVSLCLSMLCKRI